MNGAPRYARSAPEENSSTEPIAGKGMHPLGAGFGVPLVFPRRTLGAALCTVSLQAAPLQVGKRVELLREAFPNAHRAGFLWDSASQEQVVAANYRRRFSRLPTRRCSAVRLRWYAHAPAVLRCRPTDRYAMRVCPSHSPASRASRIHLVNPATGHVLTGDDQ